jgi:nucleotide-binding universal stress UspA family protein
MSPSFLPRKIVVPLDGGPERDNAIAIGQELAQRMNIHAELISIVSEGLADFDAAELENQALRLRFGVTARVIVGEDPALELRQVMEEPGALLCLASSGRTALSEVLTASVSEAIIRETHHPLIAVGPECQLFGGTQLAIALDGTVAAEWIIEPALDLADALELEPVFYQVARTHLNDEPTDLHEIAYLSEVAGRYERPKGPIRCELLHGRRVGRALAELASQRDVAILALSSHGMQPYERLVSPSITHHLIRHAECPLFIGSREVPDEPPFDHGAGARVVVGVDGSTADRWAIEFAAEAALRHQASLEIVHAWLRTWYVGDDDPRAGKTADVARREAEEILGRAVKLAYEFSPTVDVVPWLAGRAASDALVEAAHGAELIVLGEHRYNLIEEAVLGSTITEVLQRVLIPVIVVPEPTPAATRNSPSVSQ